VQPLAKLLLKARAQLSLLHTSIKERRLRARARGVVQRLRY
jgi:hypothetical protein